MTATLLCEVAAGDGTMIWRDGFGEPSRLAFMPPISFARQQSVDIPVTLGHKGWELGTAEYLVRTLRNRSVLLMVVRTDDIWGEHLEMYPHRVSAVVDAAEIEPRRYAHGRVREFALVKDPAATGLKPVRVVLGDIGGYDATRPRDLSLAWPGDLWERVGEHLRAAKYMPADFLQVDDVDPIPDDQLVLTDPDAARQRLEQDLAEAKRGVAEYLATARRRNAQKTYESDNRVYRHTYPAGPLHLS